MSVLSQTLVLEILMHIEMCFLRAVLLISPENAYMLEVKYTQRTVKNMELLKSCLDPSFAYGAVNLMQCH